MLYARISVDKSGDEVGVTRQLHDMRKLAEGRDFEVVAEITENDISASKGLRRPGYERVWRLVTSEQVDHVIAWQSSRLMRSRKDRAEVINTFGRHNVDIIAVKGPSFDLRSAYGRGMADMATSFDTMESEVKAERVSAAIADLARRGKAWGYCPYGWDRTGAGIHAKQVVNEHEATIVRELVERLLAGESLNELTGHTDRVQSVAFSHDGHWLASASSDRSVRVWNADTGAPLGPPLSGHTDVVTSLAFDPNGHRLASGGGDFDSTVRVWNLDTGQAFGIPLSGHAAGVSSLAYSPDGNLLASASFDGTVRLWPADASPEMLCAKLTTNMSHQQWREWISADPDIGYSELCPGLPPAA